MEFIENKIGPSLAVEVISDKVIIHSEQDALDIMADIGYLYNSQKIIIHKKNLSERFFDLKTGLAGDILQKFSNYRTQLAIVGDFSPMRSKSLADFIRESNRSKRILFVSEVQAALREWE